MGSERPRGSPGCLVFLPRSAAPTLPHLGGRLWSRAQAGLTARGLAGFSFSNLRCWQDDFDPESQRGVEVLRSASGWLLHARSQARRQEDRIRRGHAVRPAGTSVQSGVRRSPLSGGAFSLDTGLSHELSSSWKNLRSLELLGKESGLTSPSEKQEYRNATFLSGAPSTGLYSRVTPVPSPTTLSRAGGGSSSPGAWLMVGTLSGSPALSSAHFCLFVLRERGKRHRSVASWMHPDQESDPKPRRVP